MGYAPKVKQYKYKNISATLAVCLLCVLAISTSCNSSVEKKNDVKVQTSSSQTEKKNDKTQDSSSSRFVSEKLTKNYKYQSIKNSAELGNGNLVVVNQDHPFSGTVEDTDGIYSYLFDGTNNQIMYASNTSISAKKETLVQFNKIATDFYKAKDLSTLMIVGGLNADVLTQTTNDSSGETVEVVGEPEDNTSDNATGLSLDLQLYIESEGTYPNFTGEGDYAWIAQNCWKYGFVLRYPADKSAVTGNSGVANHFRYVGAPFAEIMQTNSLALEEVSDYVKKYTFENPMSFEAFDGKKFVIYYVEMSKETTTKIPIPLDDNNDEYKYTMSGNNIDGYIVCVDMTDYSIFGSGAGADSSENNDDTSIVDQ